jgi:TPR repeat protein
LGLSKFSLRALFFYFAFLFIFSATVGAQQKPLGTQSANTTRWTEDDRKELLTKAQHGDANSQLWLAAAYEQGWFGERNVPEALKWFRKSAAKGNPDAQNSLGQMYEDGEGVKHSYVLAAKWYRKAAEHVPDLGGAGQGRNHLGLLYMEGLGVPLDYVQAYMWFSLAGVDENIAYAAERMNAGQILLAQQMADEWKRQHPDPIF